MLENIILQKAFQSRYYICLYMSMTCGAHTHTHTRMHTRKCTCARTHTHTYVAGGLILSFGCSFHPPPPSFPFRSALMYKIFCLAIKKRLQVTHTHAHTHACAYACTRTHTDTFTNKMHTFGRQKITKNRNTAIFSLILKI